MPEPTDGRPDPGAAVATPSVPPIRAGQPPLAILVDYDGTIALTDVSDTITDALLPADLERELAELYDTGRLGSREIMEREIATLPPDPEIVNRIVAAQPHDPSFGAFVRVASAAGIPVEIVSDGFGFFIGPAMERLGVRDLVTIATARTTFDGGRPRIAFPNGHPACFVCGTCKRNRVLAHRAAGRAVLFIGDGESDRYAAGYSDFTFAKRGLVTICAGHGWPYARWERFDEIERWLRGRLDAWAAAPPGDILARRDPGFFCGPEAWGPGLVAPPEPFTIRGGESALIGSPHAHARSGPAHGTPGADEPEAGRP